MNLTSHEKLQPLTSQAYYILLSLASRPMHGYGILQQCQTDSGGLINLSRGTVYTTLNRLAGSHLIKIEANEQNDGKYYQLTPTGRAVLRAETERYRDAAAIAITRLRESDEPASTAPNWM